MGDMGFVDFAINFLVDEVSGDSEYDSVGAAAAAAAAAVASCGPDQRDHQEAIQGQYSRIDDVGDVDDRESAVDAAGSDMEGSEDGRELVGDSDREDDDDDDDEDDDCAHSGEEEGVIWWSTAPEVGNRYEKMEEEKGDQRRRISDADRVEAARERDRRFWERCLASGYP